jgi:putative restriction endonuclease
MARYNRFLGYFRQLKVDRSHGTAPHKPLLLLTLLERCWRGQLDGPTVEYDASLESDFKANWELLVTSKHQRNAVLPFFHLRTEPFWSLVPQPGQEHALDVLHGIRSVAELHTFVAHAELDRELFYRMAHPETGFDLANALLETYFPDTGARFWSKDFGDFFSRSLSLVAEEAAPPTDAVHELAQFEARVRRAYHDTCAFSGYRLLAAGLPAVEACPIVPLHVAADYSPRNGLALGPHVRWAFEQGLLTIDPRTYTVTVAPLIECGPLQGFSLHELHGRVIRLPFQEADWPNPDHLAWHREVIFRAS